MAKKTKKLKTERIAESWELLKHLRENKWKFSDSVISARSFNVTETHSENGVPLQFVVTLKIQPKNAKSAILSLEGEDKKKAELAFSSIKFPTKGIPAQTREGLKAGKVLKVGSNGSVVVQVGKWFGTDAKAENYVAVQYVEADKAKNEPAFVKIIIKK
jgi:hypothetical protein